MSGKNAELLIALLPRTRVKDTNLPSFFPTLHYLVTCFFIRNALCDKNNVFANIIINLIKNSYQYRLLRFFSHRMIYGQDLSGVQVVSI